MEVVGSPVSDPHSTLPVDAPLRGLIDAAPDPIVAVDDEGLVMLWNPAAEQVFGWTAIEVLRRPYPLVPDQGRAEYERLCALARAGESVPVVETQRMRRDGTLIDVRISTAPLRGAAGHVCGVMAILTDITERRQLERQLMQAQKMEVVGQLVGGLAHDFNNLLTPILGYCQVLGDHLAADPMALADLEEIRRAGERARDLVRQLLGFSRKQPHQLEVLNLNEDIEELRTMVGRVIGDDIRLQYVLDPDIGLIRAARGQVQQILMNLLLNARDAMPQGGSVTVRTANIMVDEPLAKRHPGAVPGPSVAITVTDTGNGMSRETLSRIFEPFFTTKAPGKGTGLGLTMVYSVVQQCGGYLTVDSTEGVGTTVVVYFPRVNTRVDRPSEPALLPTSRGTETVLVAEDEPSVRRLIQRTLQSHGYAVLCAADGLEAQTLAERHAGSIDLLVSDITMPGLCGPDLAQRLLHRRPGLKVLLVSGYADVVRRAHTSPNIGVLDKPFTPAVLAQRVRHQLDGRASVAHEPKRDP